MVPQIVKVAAARRSLRVVGPASVLLASLMAGWVVDKEMARNILTIWAATMVLPTLTQLAVSHRNIRNVGWFVTGFLMVFLFGLHSTLALILTIDIRADLFVVLSLVGGVVFFTWMGRGLLRRVAYAYQAKRVSDQMLLIDVWWFIYTSCFCVFLTITVGWWGLVWGAVPLLAARSVLAIGLLRNTGKSQGEKPVHLLFLRVFGFQKRTEHLLEEVGHHWRYIESIQLIAAPDAAGTTLEPYELLDCVGGRLSRAFIKDGQDLKTRLSSIDDKPAPDGRYRVNEFFCQTNTWKQTVQWLTAFTHVVLMDLHGFSPENLGCIFEIQQLFDYIPTSRLLFVTDETTDHTFLENTLHSAWRTMSAESPSRNGEHDHLRIYRVKNEGHAAVRRIVSLLCQSA